MHKLAMRTGSLVPQHTWVPWVVFDGHFNADYQDRAQRNFLELLCSIYKGEPPTVCK